MKTLDTLIRLHKRTLDELRRNMVSLENQKSQLQQAIVNLQKDLDKEMLLAGEQPEMSHFFGEFAKRIKNRQDNLRDEIRSLDIKITELNGKIFEAFAELKKYEIARENAKQRAREAENRKETIMLDEIAAQQFLKKQSEA